MSTVYRRCCGIDVHKKAVTVCILPPDDRPNDPVKKRSFRTFTRNLIRLRTWLKQCQVTDVVMESTGQYWRPVWNILEEADIQLMLVNPQHVKALAGRKTDYRDSQWLARMLARGELEGSFVPLRWLRELRELTRSRVHLLEDINRVKNRISQLCEAGNIKVSSVASDLFGRSARTMLRALVEGRRDPGWMADYARGKLRSKKQELEWALEGRFTDHQRQLLARGLRQLEQLEQHVAELEAEIEQRIAPHADVIERLTTIPGVDRLVAWSVVAEIGVDMSVFPDAKHLASWAALCPGNRESGGKRLSGKTRHGNPYVRRVLCVSAWAASHARDTYLQALYHRIRGRRGHQKAIVAVAHQLLVIIYHLIRDEEVYQELGANYYEIKRKPQATRRLTERLQRLGYYVTLQPIPDPEGSPSDNSLMNQPFSSG